MNAKHENWRNQTLVNRVSSNEDIAREYYTLAKYIFTEFNGRMECIQTPLLHIASHCIELSIKSVLEYVYHHQYIALNFSKIVHSHSFKVLIPFVIKVFNKISKEHFCSKDDKDLFANTFPSLIKQLGDTLQANVTSYRYAYNLDKQGRAVCRSVPFINDNDSPNILTLSEIFENCYSALSYTLHILELIIPE